MSNSARGTPMDGDGPVKSAEGTTSGEQSRSKHWSTAQLTLAVVLVAAAVFYFVKDAEVEATVGTEKTSIKMSRKLTVESLSETMIDPVKGPVLKAFLNSAGFYELKEIDDPQKGEDLRAILSDKGYFKLKTGTLDARATSILKDQGIMNVREKDIADQLAADLQRTIEEEKSSQTNEMDEGVAINKAIERVPSISELRKRSDLEVPPFQAIATRIEAGKPPSGQPSEFQILVSDPQFVGWTVLIANPKQRARTLVVRTKRLSLAQGVPPLVQLRADQFQYLQLVPLPNSDVNGDTATILISRDPTAECFQQPVKKSGAWTLKTEAVTTGGEAKCD